VRHDARCAARAFGVQRGRGCALFEHVGNQGGVAVDVGADLQDRRFPVAARERGEQRLGHDHGDEHAAPGQALVAQDQPDLLGKGRVRVVVEDELGHGVWAFRSA
jgi:hypothetical protein